MNTKKVVITGGPSTGKTAVVNHLEERGFTCLHEVIRLMTLEKKAEKGAADFKTNPIVSVADPMAFNQRILDARLAQYATMLKSKDPIAFFDRGLPDVLAYMDCFNQRYGADFEKACAANRYDIVCIMPPWKEIHTIDNERFESYDESLQLHDCLVKSYTRFGYDVNIVPKTTVRERAEFLLATANSYT